MKRAGYSIMLVVLLCAAALTGFQGVCSAEKIGVLYVIHGGMDTYHPNYLFDSSVQMFALRPDHIVHRLFVWNKGEWGSLLAGGDAAKEIKKYAFSYERIGGFDPFQAITDSQIAQLEAELNAASCSGTTFVVDYACYMAGDQVEQFPYPRYLYYPPSHIVPQGSLPEENIAGVTYCGEQERDYVVVDFSSGSAPFTAGATLSGGTSGATGVIESVEVTSGSWAGGDAAGMIHLAGMSYISGQCARTGGLCTSHDDCGFIDSCLGDYYEPGETISDGLGGAAVAASTIHWPDCDPERYNVDGPIERFIAEGVDRIIAVDVTTGCVRFFKPYYVLEMCKIALSEYGSSIPITWVNDPTDLMVNSRPIDPVGLLGIWTADLLSVITDVSIPFEENPNPVAEDMDLALLHVEGIEAGRNPAVSWADTGVLILNHAIADYAQYHDPKINDTLVINQNIKNLLIARHPDIDPDNIVGAYMGIKQTGAEEVPNKERTRGMRGESLGYAWLYEQPNGTYPGGEWGYLYWDALELLKNQGVQHIIIGFPQVIVDSVLTDVEVPNQVGKEIGIKNWLYWGTFDYAKYPGVGHPFADYWGMWVDTECIDGGGPTQECCFEMGGCPDGRPYPPPRQTDGPRDDMDPSLAYDLSDFGHLGYDESGTSGAPDPENPVQDQYTGTWAMYHPPNDDPRVSEMLAKYVLMEAGCATVVELAEFSADPGSGRITLRWATASEIDNAGFNLYRSDARDGEYVKINKALIPAEGSPDTGATYEFVDTGVKNRKAYHYKLEDVDRNGTATLHGPVSATPRLLHAFGL